MYDGVVFLLTIIKLGRTFILLRCEKFPHPKFTGANRRQYKNFRSPVQTLLLRDGVLYFAISVIVSITDIVLLQVIKSPTIASTVIPLHVGLASIMTTRLVNNVFHVVTDQSSAARVAHFPSDTKVNSKGSRKNASQSAIKKLPAPPSGQSPTFSHTIIIGSGVGTDFFDSEVSVSEDTHEMVIGSGKGLDVENQKYPLQVRKPLHIGSDDRVMSPIYVETERVVIKDETKF